MKRLTIILVLVFSCFLVLSCSGAGTATIVRLGAMDQLEQGNYSGSTVSRALLDSGDFGLGTFDKLDGEMVVLNDGIWQVKADGNILDARSQTALFALVTSFSPDVSEEIGMTNLDGLKQLVERVIDAKEEILAIKIRGVFSAVRTRSVPAQNQPFPLLSEVIKQQSVFEREDVQGTAVGYRTPASTAATAGTGYHFHFLADDHSIGGHVLDLTLEHGLLEISRIDALEEFR